MSILYCRQSLNLEVFPSKNERRWTILSKYHQAPWEGLHSQTGLFTTHPRVTEARDFDKRQNPIFLSFSSVVYHQNFPAMPLAGICQPNCYAFLQKNNNLPSKSSGQLSDSLSLEQSAARASTIGGRRREKGRVEMKAAGGEAQSGRRSFLTLEEAGLVEMSGLSSHEKFLCRLTVCLLISQLLPFLSQFQIFHFSSITVMNC